MTGLLEDVAIRTGLAQMIAPGAVRRALEDRGIDPSQAAAADVLTVLDSLRRRLCVYMSEADAQQRIDALRDWLQDD